MRITFDAVPICSDKMTGIGWCELGQTQTLAELFPENSYEYSFFTSGDKERVKRVKKFAGTSIKLNTSGFSGFSSAGSPISPTFSTTSSPHSYTEKR